MTRRNGVTLIELLVVIAIIAIIAAILFPVFAKAREKGRQESCRSNLKQIVLAAQLYESEYGQLPTARSSAPEEPRTMIPALYPEIKNRQIFECPSSDGKNVVTIEDELQVNLDYSFRTEAQGRKLIHCARPQDYPLFLCLSCGTWTWDGGKIINCNTGNPLGTKWGRHSEGVNIAFLDGHVKWRSTDNFVAALQHSVAEDSDSERIYDYSVKLLSPAATPERPARAPSLPDGVYSFNGRATVAGGDIKLEGTLTPAKK